MTGFMHKVHDALLESKDDKAEEKRTAEAQRDAQAEARLAQLQQNAPTGPDGHKDLSSFHPTERHAPGDLAEYRQEPDIKLHGAMSNTALRPESQEMMDGRGTAGEDLAI